MTISVNCPVCSQLLVAPDDLVGKLAACPGCNSQFPIMSDSNGPAVSPPPPPAASNGSATLQTRQASPAAPAVASPPRVPSSRAHDATASSSSATTTSSESVQRAPIEAYAPPTQQPLKPSPSRPTPSTATSTPPSEAPAELRSTAQQPISRPDPPPPNRNSNPAPATAVPAARVAKTARFIAAEATDTAVQLGQNGQLPSLVLEEGKAKGLADDEEQKSSPFLMVTVLCVSLGMSMVMLLLDTEGAPSEKEDKSDARKMIEQHYIGQPGQIKLEAYQQDLRQALRAHNKADYATERKIYQKVFFLLKAENNNELKGLTGQVSAKQHPCDQKLEELLATLLRRD